MIMRDCRGAIIATSPLPSDDQAAVESSLCIYIRCVPLSRTPARARSYASRVSFVPGAFFLTLLLLTATGCRTPRCVNGTRLCVSERRRGVEDDEMKEEKGRGGETAALESSSFSSYMYTRYTRPAGRSIIRIEVSPVPIGDLLHRSSRAVSFSLRVCERVSSVETHASTFLSLSLPPCLFLSFCARARNTNSKLECAKFSAFVWSRFTKNF